MADESVDTASTGLPSSIAETEPDFAGLVPDDGNQSEMMSLEEQILYATSEDAAPDSETDETSTPEETAAPDDESRSDEETEEESTEDTATEDTDETAEAEQDDEPKAEETLEERLARIERENEELKKRVSGKSREASPREKDAQRIAQLEERLSRLDEQRQEAERRANLKPYHFGHPEHEQYLQKKDKVKTWELLRAKAGDNPDAQQWVDGALASMGLTVDDVRLVNEGRDYEEEHARRFATDPRYQRQVLQNQIDSIMQEKQRHAQAVAESERLFADESNMALMEKYREDFDTLWNSGWDARAIFERLHRQDAEAQLKEAKAAKNRVKASKQSASDLAKKKAATAAETRAAPPGDALWASDLVDKIESEYNKKYPTRTFDIMRRDCQEFFEERATGAMIQK